MRLDLDIVEVWSRNDRLNPNLLRVIARQVTKWKSAILVHLYTCGVVTVFLRDRCPKLYLHRFFHFYLVCYLLVHTVEYLYFILQFIFSAYFFVRWLFGQITHRPITGRQDCGTPSAKLMQRNI